MADRSMRSPAAAPTPSKPVMASMPVLESDTRTKRNTSAPAPPISESAPAPPVRVSLPVPPLSWSSPARPLMRSLPAPPSRRFATAEPVSVSRPAPRVAFSNWMICSPDLLVAPVVRFRLKLPEKPLVSIRSTPSPPERVSAVPVTVRIVSLPMPPSYWPAPEDSSRSSPASPESESVPEPASSVSLPFQPKMVSLS